MYHFIALSVCDGFVQISACRSLLEHQAFVPWKLDTHTHPFSPAVQGPPDFFQGCGLFQRAAERQTEEGQVSL